MTTESKQTSPFYVPRFTPANYGSFFIAGQFLLQGCLSVLRPLPQEHYVLRAHMLSLQMRQSILTFVEEPHMAP